MGDTDRPRRGRISLRAIAHHEAGHAVAACHFHVLSGCTTIVPDGDGLGKCFMADPGVHKNVFRESNAILRIKMEGYLIAGYAGPMAQRRFLARSCWAKASRSDYFKNFLIANKIHDAEYDAQCFCDYLEIRAKTFVDRQWPTIQMVAAALLERKTLERRDVERLCWD